MTSAISMPDTRQILSCIRLDKSLLPNASLSSQVSTAQTKDIAGMQTVVSCQVIEWSYRTNGVSLTGSTTLLSVSAYFAVGAVRQKVAVKAEKPGWRSVVLADVEPVTAGPTQNV
ncbi:MAG: hypothetical protein HWE26_00870 [Alteromonadaceae bacterium]|nr:hypothetical protein [Alteromonadaceae bacterium]